MLNRTLDQTGHKHTDTLASLMQMGRLSPVPLGDGSRPVSRTSKHNNSLSLDQQQPQQPGVWSYRSSLNLKWKESAAAESSSNQPQRRPSSSLSSSTNRRPSSALSSTSLAPTSQAKRAEAETCVLWRECKSETMVRREAIFYNFLLNRSDPSTTTSSTVPTAQPNTSNTKGSHLTLHPVAGREDDAARTLQKGTEDDTPTTVAKERRLQSELDVLWNVAQIAAASHLTGGDGQYFLRDELMQRGQRLSSFVHHNKPPLASGSPDSGGVNDAGISAAYLLKLYGNERTYQLCQSSGSSAARGHALFSKNASSSSLASEIERNSLLEQTTRRRGGGAEDGGKHSRLHRATSYLLTEPYDLTLAEYLKLSNGLIDCVQIQKWTKQMAFQLSEIHRAGVAMSLISAETTALVGLPRHPSKGTVDARPTALPVGSVKLSWLFCATMMDLDVVRGLRKQTLSQSRCIPESSEYHTLRTADLPESIVQLASTYASVLPPEWFVLLKPDGTVVQQQLTGESPSGADGRRTAQDRMRLPTTATTAGKGGANGAEGSLTLHLREQVAPTAKSDAYLFGKFLQQLYIGSFVEFNPQSVPTVASGYYFSTPAVMKVSNVSDDTIPTCPPPSGCPSNIGPLRRVDEVNMESLRHLIAAATMEDTAVRWQMTQLANHPFFWGTSTIVQFFSLVAEFSFPPLVSMVAQSAANMAAEQITVPLGFDVTQADIAKRRSRVTLRAAALRDQQVVTRKSNITAPELAELRHISKSLSAWCVECRNWMIPELYPWLDAFGVEPFAPNANVRNAYENLMHQLIEFILNVYRHMSQVRPIPSICEGDADRFLTTIVHRMFPTLLMETLANVMNEDEDSGHFVRFTAAKLRMALKANASLGNGSSTEQQQAKQQRAISDLCSILNCVEKLHEEGGKTMHAAGLSHVVQVLGCLPQFPVHVPDIERTALVKKNNAKVKSTSKNPMQNLPKWAQIQIAEADAEALKEDPMLCKERIYS